MKKISLIFCSILISISISAQDFISTFLGKCGEKDKLEVVTIGKKMLELLGAMNTQGKEFAEVLSGLESIRIVSSEDTVLNNEYYEAAYQLLTKRSQGFEELISVHDDDENMVIMIKENKGTVKELVLLSNGGSKQQFNVIALNGKINLDKLVKYSKDLNINGLEKLNAVRSKE